ncbi:CPBP family intramembrane glutamic endopeptidase [Halosimplex halophilum]|uniref:CPBP family intramembrane glutamic endopeptidase n=1 Tax=Halosimplex halophilum TaxID=2559572 RepID=UPI00143556EE|nr:CPBP family intramembrane glutamic endopeptidase [Halosimplex halophilum]
MTDVGPLTTATLKELEQRDTASSYEMIRRVARLFFFVLFEELIFRGLPFYVSTHYFGYTLVCMVLATLLWAQLHVSVGRSRTLLPYLPSGFFYMYLWLNGLGLLAIGFHALNNLVAVNIPTLRRLYRTVNPNLFTPGEEHFVTVRSSSSTNPRRCTAETGDGRWVVVTDVRPETVCRVRIVKGGNPGYGYPLAVAETTDWTEIEW